MKLKKDFIIREIAGQYVIVPTGEEALRYNGLLTISSTAAFLLNNYANAEDLNALIKMLMDEFEVDPKTAIEDVLGFTKTMLDRGFIEMTDPDRNW